MYNKTPQKHICMYMGDTHIAIHTVIKVSLSERASYQPVVNVSTQMCYDHPMHEEQMTY